LCEKRGGRNQYQYSWISFKFLEDATIGFAGPVIYHGQTPVELNGLLGRCDLKKREAWFGNGTQAECVTGDDQLKLAKILFYIVPPS
jgi:hypothetical protein